MPSWTIKGFESKPLSQTSGASIDVVSLKKPQKRRQIHAFHRTLNRELFSVFPSVFLKRWAVKADRNHKRRHRFPHYFNRLVTVIVHHLLIMPSFESKRESAVLIKIFLWRYKESLWRTKAVSRLWRLFVEGHSEHPNCEAVRIQDDKRGILLEAWWIGLEIL